MFKKFLAVMALALCTVSVNAADIDTRNLSDAQIAEIKSIAAKTSAANELAKIENKSPQINLANAASWGKQASEAAEGFGRAFTVAAREMGVTANEFFSTPVGKVTAALIIWKVMGAAIVKLLFASVVMILGLTGIRLIYCRVFTKGFEKVDYSLCGGFFKGTKLRRIPKGFADLNCDGEWLAFWLMIILLIVTVLATGGLITTI